MTDTSKRDLARLLARARRAIEDPASQGKPPATVLTVQITSPLGRTGIVGPVRIVARITGLTPGATLSPVQFFVDGNAASSTVYCWLYSYDYDNTFLGYAFATGSGAFRAALSLTPAVGIGFGLYFTGMVLLDTKVRMASLSSGFA